MDNLWPWIALGSTCLLFALIGECAERITKMQKSIDTKLDKLCSYAADLCKLRDRRISASIVENLKKMEDEDDG